MLDSINRSKQSAHFIELNADSFSKTRDLSADFAIFEKTQKAVVCQIKINWTDLGSWSSFYEYTKPTASPEGNVSVGQNINLFNCENSLFYAQNEPRLVINNVNNLSVICTRDVVFITPRTKTEETKDIYKQLQANKIDITSNTTKCYRPWGYYEVILKKENYIVKHICIFPSQEISLHIITKGMNIG